MEGESAVFVGATGWGIGGPRTFNGVGIDGFCGIIGGGNRRSWSCVGVRIGGFCGRNGVGIGGRRTFNGVRIDASRRCAVRIGGQRTFNGVRNDRGGASRSAGPRGVGGRAGRHRQRGRCKRMTTWGDSGQPLPRYEPWWPYDEPLRAVVATRSRTTRLADSSHPHLARIGVGAVQNRPQNHRVIRDICGDAGQPAHQRPETPRCARHRDASIRTPTHNHDRRFPPRGTTTIVSHPDA
jgi:hypothetical protein